MPFHKLVSGFRIRKPEKTFALIKEFALSKGITRVTEITNLDYFGVPVYASIRPKAVAGSLCVNAGKGLKAIDARVGAIMEAIEFYYAEPGNSNLKVKKIFPDRLHIDSPPGYILDFCPLFGTEIDLNKKIGCVEAINILNGEKTNVPAERVFFPCTDHLSIHTYFGSSTNGLASGNHVAEATLHGIIELIERDIKSFHTLQDNSVLLNYDTLPKTIRSIIHTVNELGYFISIRYMPNQYNLPCFAATLGNINDGNPIYICGGYGCHLSRVIALNRAVTECFQSRLSFIHGGRDDLEERYELFRGWTSGKKKKYCEQLISKIMSRETHQISFQKIPDKSMKLFSVEEALVRINQLLFNKGFDKILRVVFTKKSDVVQVVRIIIPRMENFDESMPGIGNRLKEYASDVFK